MGLSDRLPPIAKQTWVVSSILIMVTEQGMMLGHASSLVRQLKDPGSSIPADMATITWIVSSVSYALFLGLLLSSILMDRWGRRTTYIVFITPAMVGWSCVYFSNGVLPLVVGRMLGGVTGGGIVLLGAVIIGEFTTPKYRGIFLTLKTAAIAFGCMISHILGNFFHWRTIALFALIPNILAISIAFTWPDTPAWLASTKQFKKCEESFTWLRGSDEYQRRELQKLIKAQNVPVKKICMLKNIVKFFKKFLRKDFIKPVVNLFFASVILEACGKHYFASYASMIVGDIVTSSYNPFYFTLCLDIIITGSVIMSTILVRVMKRRTLLFSTGISGLVVLSLAVTYIYLTSKGLVTNYPWVSIGLLVAFFILVNLGCTPMMLTWMGELLPLEHRSAGCLVCGVIMNLSIVATMKITPYLISSLEVYGMFGVYGFAVAISLLILYFIAPETKDKTLQEIEEYFGCGKYVDDRKEEGVRMIEDGELKTRVLSLILEDKI